MNAPHTPASHFLRAADFPNAVDLAHADPDCYVEVFVASWPEVDVCRNRAAELGLAGRIGVHHHSALDLLIELEVLTRPDPTPPSRRQAAASLIRRLDSVFRAAATSLSTTTHPVGTTQSTIHEQSAA